MALEEVLIDFQEITHRVHEVHAKHVAKKGGEPIESLKKPFHISAFDAEIDRLESDVLIYPKGVVWYQGMEDIGDPKDYAGIREDPEELKRFLGKLLDKGRISEDWGMAGINELNPADYAVWIYQFSENQIFRRNFERVASEMLKEEFEKQRPSFATIKEKVVQETMERLRNQDLKTHRTEGDYIQNLVKEWGEKAREPSSKPEGFFEDPHNFWLWSKREAGDSITPEEREQLVIEIGEIEWNPERISRGLIQRLIPLNNRRREYRARKHFDINIESQEEYNRFIGTIDIVRLLAERREKSPMVSKGHKILSEYKDDITLGEDNVFDYYSSKVNLPTLVLRTLSCTQQQDGLMRDFWLERMRTEEVCDRYLAAFNGLMHSVKKPQRKDQVPNVLEILQQREFKLGNPLKGHYGQSRDSNEDILNKHLRSLSGIATNRSFFSFFPKHIKLTKATASLEVNSETGVLLQVSPEGYKYPTS